MLIVNNLVIFMVFVCDQYYIIFFSLYNGVSYCFSMVFYYFGMFGI